MLVFELAHSPRMHALPPRPAVGRAGARHEAEDDWGPFTRLGGVISLRSGVYFGLQSFVPLWFVHQLGSTEAAGQHRADRDARRGARGTLVGGRLVDRIGRRPVLLGSVAAAAAAARPARARGSGPAVGLLALIGFVTIATFSVTVVMGQEYLPRRLGIASGVTLGLGDRRRRRRGDAAGRPGRLRRAPAVMWTIAVLPIPAILLTLTLPREGARRGRFRLRPARAGA